MMGRDKMQAVVETGGKQYVVQKGDEILVEKLTGKEGSQITLSRVLLIVDGKKVSVGKPTVAKAKVKAKLLGEEKGDKKVIFKFKRRKGYRRKIGHRQKYTKIKIEKIEVQ